MSALSLELNSKKKLSNRQCETYFLDWCNNFLSLGRFSEHYGMTEKKANTIISKGRKFHKKRDLILNGYRHIRSLKQRAK